MAITRGGALCRSDGSLGPPEFETVMREQLRLYSQTRLSTSSEHFVRIDPTDLPLIAAMKQLLIDQTTMQDAMGRLFEDIAALRRAKTSTISSSCCCSLEALNGGRRIQLRRCRRISQSGGAFEAAQETWIAESLDEDHKKIFDVVSSVGQPVAELHNLGLGSSGTAVVKNLEISNCEGRASVTASEPAKIGQEHLGTTILESRRPPASARFKASRVNACRPASPLSTSAGHDAARPQYFSVSGDLVHLSDSAGASTVSPVGDGLVAERASLLSAGSTVGNEAAAGEMHDSVRLCTLQGLQTTARGSDSLPRTTLERDPRAFCAGFGAGSGGPVVAWPDWGNCTNPAADKETPLAFCSSPVELQDGSNRAATSRVSRPEPREVSAEAGNWLTAVANGMG